MNKTKEWGFKKDKTKIIWDIIVKEELNKKNQNIATLLLKYLIWILRNPYTLNNT